jgi:hypothetical protein
MGPPVRSKKMAVLSLKPAPLDVTAATGHIQRKMVRIDPMADRGFSRLTDAN